MPISIAIIDSGVDPLSLSRAQLGQLLRIRKSTDHYRFSRSLTDCVGHGTACAELISRLHPAALLHSLAITDAAGVFEAGALAAALEWCIQQQIRIVNVSLGTTDVSHREMLASICVRAKAAGTIVVAAQHNEGLISYPAHCPSTLAVGSGRLPPGQDLLHCAGSPVEWFARGDRQRVRWTGGGDRMASGSSFAAPRLTAMVAGVLTRLPDATPEQVREELLKGAGRVRVEAIPDEVGPAEPQVARGRAALYPYTKEMHALVRFRDLLPFEVTGVADPPGRRNAGKDAGEAIGRPPVGVTITASLPRALEGADLLVLGYVKKLGSIQRKDVQAEAIAQALDASADVFAFERVDTPAHADLHHRAASLKRTLRCPALTLDRVRPWFEAPTTRNAVDRPVLGVFGTSSAQGKFTLQLALRRALLRHNYRVGQLATEHHAELFGVDVAFPMGYDACVDLPIDLWADYLDRRLGDLCRRRHPDLIIVGSQSGTIPYDVRDLRTQTLPTLAFLFGTQPDASILVVNTEDEEDYICATIAALEALSQTKVIALAFSDRCRVAGRGSNQGGSLKTTEVRQFRRELTRRHHRPAFCIGQEEDIQRLTDHVIESFVDPAERMAA